MKLFALTALLGAMLILTGCPLQTTSPVDEGSYAGTGWLTGKWIQQKDDGTAGKAYLIKNGDRPGNIRVYSVIAGETETKFRPVVVSSVGSKAFISAYDEGDEVDDKGYYIFQLIKKSSQEFDLLPVREHSVGADASSKELKAWLRDNADGDIYETGETEHYRKG